MVQTNNSEVLYSWAKVFANVYAMIYAVWMCYNARLTFVSSKCAVPLPYSGCISLIVVLLIMALTSVFLSDGLKGGRADEMVPWLFCTIPVEIAGIVLLFNTSGPLDFVVIVILVLNILTWYPIFSIYRKLSKNSNSAEATAPTENSVATCLSTGSTMDVNGSYATTSTLVTARNSLATAADKPPAYDSILDIPGSNPLQSIAALPAYDTGCKIDMDSRTTEKSEKNVPVNH